MSHSKHLHTISKNINQNYLLRGTIILTITGLLTRCVGFYNRIFLNDRIGATQLGLYQLVLPIYMILYSLTTYGIEIALTKIISELHSRRLEWEARQYMMLCFFLCFLQGLFCSILLYRYSTWISHMVLHTPDCVESLRILAFGIPFMAAKASIHGYFLGKGQSGIHGISDLIEQVTKIGSLILLSSFVSFKANYSSSFACVGIVFGELISFLFCVFFCFFCIKKAPHPKALTTSNPFHSITCQSSQIKRFDYYKKLKNLLSTAFPLTVNRLFLTTIQSIEAILIPSVLYRYYHKTELSLSIYGMFSGIAFPCILLPATLTNSLSTMLLPAVSTNNCASKKKELSNLCEKSLRVCLGIGFLSMFFFYILGKQIGVYIFQSTRAGTFLHCLSLLCPFLYLSTVLASILNGLGYSFHNLLFNLLATSIRILFILYAVPRLGILGYILGLFCSYCLLTLTSISKLHRHLKPQHPSLIPLRTHKSKVQKLR